VPALAGQARPDLILLNDDDLGYTLIRFDERSAATLAESIGDVTDPLARTICWTAVLDMVAQAEMSVPQFMEILIRGIKHEESIPLLQLILTQAQDVVLGILAEPFAVRLGKGRAAAQFMRLLLTAERGSDLQLASAQALTWSAATAEQLDLLTQMLDGRTDISGLDVDTDLRWAILARLAATGRAGDAEIDAELVLDPTDDGRRQALACRAAIPDTEHKAAAWDLLAGDDEIGYETAILVGRAFRQPEHAELLEQYAERYFEVLPKLWETRSHQSRIALARMLFPFPAASAALIARVGVFLAEPDIDSGLVRLLVEQRDVVERALHSRALST
jgi:aminopeptidase N